MGRKLSIDPQARTVGAIIRGLFRFKVFELDSASCTQAVQRLLDTAQEARIMLETVFEPVLFRLEADQ